MPQFDLYEEPKTQGTGFDLVEPVFQANIPRPAEQQSELGWKASDVVGMGDQVLDPYRLPQAQDDAAFVLSFIPFAKYALPAERAKFEEMDDDEKAAALGWEAFGAGLMFGTGVVIKHGGKAINKLAKWAHNRRLLKVQPVEDALHSLKGAGGEWRGFDYHTEVAKKVRGMRFAGEEAEAVAQVIVGDADTNVLKAVAWEKGGKLSKAWKQQIGRLGEKMDGGLLRKELDIPLDMADALRPQALRSNWAQDLYKANLKIGKVSPNVNHVERMIHQHTKMVYGDEVAKGLDLGTVGEEEMANLLASLYVPKGRRAISLMHRLGATEHTIPWMKPERFVYGAGEQLYKTKSKVFDKLIEAQRASNAYRVNLNNTFMAMLQQRGFGTIAKEATGWRFKPNKALWKNEILDGAKQALTKIDNLAEAGRAGKNVTQTEARMEINKLLGELKENSPAVFELVDLTHAYTDVLYKDMVQQYVPYLVSKLPLNQRGQAFLGQVSKLWGTRAEQLFNTASKANAADKVGFTKQMLKDYQKMVKNPNFYGQLTKGQKAAVEDALKSLKYGSNHHAAMPKYLEGYMPRVAARGEKFAGFAKQALVGESGFVKGRKQISSGQLVETFQEMIEARTGSQAKQMHFYREAADVIEYAKTLPDAWRSHVDFTISRMIGQPSNWDHKLATVLSKIPGTGSWDEYRAMRAAKRITGMAYSGMLGLRPFSCFRNLTQPLLMTPPEMGGGVRDMASLIRGLARAGSPKHRAYIRQIGAITDFVPDQQVRPMLPKLGIGGHYDSIRDSFLYFFRQSDKWNRYWSGAAAVEKWEWAAKSAGGGPANAKAFARKLGLRFRPDWEQTEIRNLLKLGRLDEAKAVYTKGIIADTQYLYTTAESPRMMGSGGAQRTFMTFQSWWMNYGSAVSRWATTGQASDRVKRMGMAMVTAAMTEQLLESWAGRGTAIRSVGMGPFPMGDAGMPPAMEVIWNMMGAAKQTYQGVAFNDAESRQKAVQHFKRLASTGVAMGVPGGLMMQMAARGYQKDEWPGLMMGIIQKSDEDFEPLFGLVE